MIKITDVAKHFPNAEFSPFGPLPCFGENYYTIKISERITLTIHEKIDDVYARSYVSSEPDQYGNIMMNFMDHLINSIEDVELLVAELKEQ